MKSCQRENGKYRLGLCSGNLIFYTFVGSSGVNVYRIRCENHFFNVGDIRVISESEYEAGVVISQ
jgi:hypothetical protein